MSASILESQAAFVERAKAINMPDALIDLMIEKGLTSFGKLAFISPVEPRSGDDSSMVQAVGAILGRGLRPAEIPDMRRLWFESHTLAVSDMKTRIERSSLDPPREMPLAERMNRLEDQKKRLPSIVFSEHVEPAHCLIDKVQNMLESGYLTYLPPHKCPSRATEITADKATPQLTFDAQGAIKVSKKQSDLECNTFGELKLKEALQRRSLAFDQIHLMSFIVQEKWRAHLFQSITRDPPPGHRYVSIAQALNADREFWQLISEEARGSLKVTSTADPPLDALAERYMHVPQVAICLSTLPGQPRSKGDGKTKTDAHVEPPPPPTSWGGGKGGKSQKGGKGKQTHLKKKEETQPDKRRAEILKLLKEIPEGCVSRLEARCPLLRVFSLTSHC